MKSVLKKPYDYFKADGNNFKVISVRWSPIHWEIKLFTVDKSCVGYGEINDWLLSTNFSWTKSFAIEPNKI